MCTFQHCGCSGTWIFCLCGRFDTGTLLHGDFMARGLFGTGTFFTRIFRHRDILVPWTFWHGDIVALGNFGKRICWQCGHFGMRTLWHWDISAQGYFGTVDVSAQGHILETLNLRTYSIMTISELKNRKGTKHFVTQCTK